MKKDTYAEEQWQMVKEDQLCLQFEQTLAETIEYESQQLYLALNTQLLLFPINPDQWDFVRPTCHRVYKD